MNEHSFIWLNFSVVDIYIYTYKHVVGTTYLASVTYERYKWINYSREYNRLVNFIRPGQFSYVTAISQRNRV